MSLLRLILLGVAIWLVWRYWQRWRALGTSAQPSKFTAMVRCAHCGIHFPREQAVEVKALTFCSQQHADLHPNGTHG